MVHAMEMSEKPLGQPWFLGAPQDATTTLLNELSPENIEKYAQVAKDWS